MVLILTWTLGIKMDMWKALVIPQAMNHNVLHEQTQKHFLNLKEPNEFRR